jgi:Tol biopolymer transport system component
MTSGVSDLRFDEELTFTPPRDLDELATVVMARGRARRRERRIVRGSALATAVLLAACGLSVASAGRAGERAGGDLRALAPVPVSPPPTAGSPGETAPEGSHGPVAAARPGSDANAATNGAGGEGQGTRVAPTAEFPASDRVAFVSAGSSGLNDVFLYEVRVGRVVPLTTSPAVDTWPSWSPDGRQIAFYSDRDGASNIYVMGADGTAQRRLTALENGYQATHPAWSPDGRTIAFTLSRRPTPYVSTTETDVSDIWGIAPDGSGMRRLVAEGAQPAWSPDGRRVAYVTADELKVADLQSGATRTLAAGYVNFPSWSPDGRRIAFQQTVDGRAQIHVVGDDGRARRRVFVSDQYDGMPSWSPDGTRLIFRHDPDGVEGVHCDDFTVPQECQGPGTAPGQIWTVGVDGRDPRALISGRNTDDFLPRFAPRAVTPTAG